MAKRIRWHEATSRAEKHTTEFEWTLCDWSSLYYAKYVNGIHSNEFELDGTDGYTCKLSLEPTKDHPLTITFSNIAQILTMTVSFSITNMKCYEHVYTKPLLQNSFSYYFHKSFDKSNRSYIFNDKEWVDDTLTVLLKITIIKESDISIVTGSKLKFPMGLAQEIDDRSLILSNSKALMENGILCDITLVVGDKEIPAHKAILAAQSRVFEKMFANDMNDREVSRHVVYNAEVEVFEKFLNYLYVGTLPDLDEHVGGVVVLADYYGVDRLKVLCENFMLAQLNEDNVIKYFTIADLFFCPNLKEAAYLWIRKSPTIFERTFREETRDTWQTLHNIFKSDFAMRVKAAQKKA